MSDFFYSLGALPLPTLLTFLIMIIINAAVTRFALQTMKEEVEKLEKRLEQLHTQLMKLFVLEARIGHTEKELSKTQSKLDRIEAAFLFRDDV